MGKLRSPILGYNHNVRYHGRIFHIQTEDSGPGNPHLYTHLFYEGTILSSKKVDYQGSAPEDEVKLLMQAQHKAMMKELKQAAFDARIASFFAARGETAELFDEPETAAPAVGPGAGATRALDLDAIPHPVGASPSGRVVAPAAVAAPIAATGTAGAPPIAAAGTVEAPPLAAEAAALAVDEALPPPSDGVPEPVQPPTSSGRMTSGVGVYVMKGRGQDRPFDPKTPTPEVVEAHPKAPLPRRSTGAHALPLGHRVEEVTVEVATTPPVPPAVRPPAAPPLAARSRLPTPPPVARPSAGAAPSRPMPHSPTAPVVVLQPVKRPTRPPTRNTPSAEGVVVQRQVVVGVGGAAPASPRPVRPARSVPYVVSGGSHAGRPTAAPAPPPRAPAPPRPAAAPPPPAAPTVASEGAPDSAFSGDLISDQSLDEVILAYLAEDSAPVGVK